MKHGFTSGGQESGATFGAIVYKIQGTKAVLHAER